ncbi:MAG: Na+/H+ antiporter, NhaA family protein, nonfunctional [Microgenomates group bacterium GW2011_GWF2_45_18]|nr:MAG: Na+/H+ antiporter, NhaA family protein, nonfunctional [Microgenomates group bacterium GW2011_GWF1_44_10]KKU01631.1 MAG: Na+/H+ antiporter, NhaA family protein, nonfunctional [Microgenomates group bacterium GW2011_GWF2_45_18]OGJ41342.1 MAG: hypothetical protein A2378_03090 [Candidatus Pacebacteria bacterium RIFOXYB1_FULL_44_10]HAU99487.1 hypothetical protein [Candidatus Paceibacterota bacterium]HAX01458.1 hypothetical protein [Candidatus Paceibacterota bacterium]
MDSTTKTATIIVFGTFVLITVLAVLFSQKMNAPLDPAKILGDARNATSSGELTQATKTLVVFSDFQCPACRATEPLIAKVMNSNPDLRVVYRHFPLITIHKNARDAAIASEIVQTQGKFWQMHDILYDRQLEWEGASSEEAKKKFAEYAQEIGFEGELLEFMQQAQEGKDSLGGNAALRVIGDVADATLLGLQATPTFYLDGKKIDATILQTMVK